MTHGACGLGNGFMIRWYYHYHHWLWRGSCGGGGLTGDLCNGRWIRNGAHKYILDWPNFDLWIYFVLLFVSPPLRK